MARYIDAEKLCKSLRDMAFYQNPYKQSTILGVVSSIENFPTAETKFDIGSKVYNAELYHEYYAEKDPYTVVGISVHISDHAMKTTYRIERGGIIRTASENFIFATYEECTKWCEEHK